MDRLITITPDDLQSALLKGAELGSIAPSLRRRLRIPAAAKTAELDVLAHLRRYPPSLHRLAQAWLQAKPVQLPGRTARLHTFRLMPFFPRENAQDYLPGLLKKIKPSVIALDASVFETAAALQYACSLHFSLGVAGRSVLHDRDGNPTAELVLRPDDFLPALALYCHRQKIPIMPMGTPHRAVASEHQYAYSTMMHEMGREFSARSKNCRTPEASEKLAESLMASLFAAGPQMMMERENCITRACALASRTYELLRAAAADKVFKGPVLVLHHIEASLDLPALLTTFRQNPAALSELSCAPEPQPTGTLSHIQPPHEEEISSAGPLSEKARSALLAVVLERMAETVDTGEADRLISAMAEALRRHPRIEHPPGVRATLAAREIAQAFALLRGSISRATLAQAVALACTHRTRMAQDPGDTWQDVFKPLASRILYNIDLDAPRKAQAKKPLRALTRDELNQALEGLMDAGVRQLDPGEALPLDNPEFNEEVMNHPMVQQALNDAAAMNDTLNPDELFSDMMQQMEERGLLEETDGSGLTLSAAGRQQYEDALKNARERGDLSAEEMAEALSKAASMPPSADATGENMPMPMSAEQQAEMLAELMDFQHQGRSESSSVEDLYVHYTIDENKGIPVSEDKVDYEKLKAILHQLEEKGQLQLSSEGRLRFTLTHRALDGLLESLVQRRDTRILEQRAFKREHETDKSEIRRYRRGDVFRDISMRHTLRRIMRKGKSIEDINYTDLRAFEKRPSNQLDIAVCVDISASMKEGGKLRYAKMAVAELCRAAIEKHDRVGIVAFSNLGDVMVPLTDTITPLLEATMHMRSKQFTNIGNGLATARRMLQKSRKENPKYIILITDGEPNAALSDDIEGSDYYSRIAEFSRETDMATKRAMGAQHALREAAQTCRSHIKISVVYIDPGEEGTEESEKVAREIARIGGGRFQLVKTIEHLPLETLGTVA